MGWFDGLFGSAKSDDSALSKLDPKLREFLEKESPIKLQPKASAQPPTKATSPTSTSPQTQAQNGAQQEQQPPAPVPAPSLYTDGRYADLWKTYRPIDAIEAENKSNHEQLMDVLEGYKMRKHLIGKAALENCALQQEEWRKCMTGGDLTDRLKMCSHQVRRFERCYTMQARFLRALGYRSEAGRDPILEEDIQMHADTLYQRMIAHEEAAALAKKEGRPVPEFQVVPPSFMAPNPGEAVQKIWKEKLDSLPEDERAAEEAALRRDYIEKQGTADAVKGIWSRDDEARRERKRQGKATPVDMFWIWMRGSKTETKDESSKGGTG